MKLITKFLSWGLLCYISVNCSSKDTPPIPCWQGAFLQTPTKCSSGREFRDELRLNSNNIGSIQIYDCSETFFITTFKFEVQEDVIVVTNVISLASEKGPMSPTFFATYGQSTPGMAKTIPFSFRYQCSTDGIKFTDAPFDKFKQVWTKTK